MSAIGIAALVMDLGAREESEQHMVTLSEQLDDYLRFNSNNDTVRFLIDVADAVITLQAFHNAWQIIEVIEANATYVLQENLPVVFALYSAARNYELEFGLAS